MHAYFSFCRLEKMQVIKLTLHAHTVWYVKWKKVYTFLCASESIEMKCKLPNLFIFKEHDIDAI